MKHWFFYARIPVEDVGMMPILSTFTRVSDRSNSIIDLQRNLHREVFEQSVGLKKSEDGTFYYGLYAWCADRDLAELFKASRNPKYFICKKMDISVETTEWEHLRSLYKDFEIIRTGYSDDDGRSYSIPMTHFESDVICDNHQTCIDALVATLLTKRSLNRKIDDDLRIVLDTFTGSLWKALDLFSFSMFTIEFNFLDCELCNVGRAGDDPDYLIEEYNETSGYDLGLSGYPMAKWYTNPLTIYIYMLGGMLDG